MVILAVIFSVVVAGIVLVTFRTTRRLSETEETIEKLRKEIER